MFIEIELKFFSIHSGKWHADLRMMQQLNISNDMCTQINRTTLSGVAFACKMCCAGSMVKRV